MDNFQGIYIPTLKTQLEQLIIKGFKFVIIIPDLSADNILPLSIITTSHEEQAYCDSKSVRELLYSNPAQSPVECPGIKFVDIKLKFRSYGFAFKNENVLKLSTGYL